MHVVERKGRRKPWLCQIKRKGFGTYSKSFKLKNDAIVWGKKEDLNIDEKGRPFTIKQYEKITVGDLCKRYLDEVSPSKHSYTTDKHILSHIHKYSIAHKSIATVSSNDAADYRNERLGEKLCYAKNVLVPISERIYLTKDKPISPSTVRRAVNTLSNVFEMAKREWGYHNITNPFSRLQIRGSHPRRNRRLRPGELDKLLKAVDKCRGQSHRQFIKLAIELAVHTGMRLQEIFNLTWEDIGVKEIYKRRIVIRKSKTDYMTGQQGRTIVMSIPARDTLMSIGLETTEQQGPFSITSKLFPMTKESFKQSWQVVKRISGIKDLTFHDLRHEAASRFDELGLSRAEHNLMMGWDGSGSASIYIHAELDRIQEKLDRPYPDKLRQKMSGISVV